MDMRTIDSGGLAIPNTNVGIGEYTSRGGICPIRPTHFQDIKVYPTFMLDRTLSKKEAAAGLPGRAQNSYMDDAYAKRYAAFNFGGNQNSKSPADSAYTVSSKRAPSVIGFHSVYDFPGWENRALEWITEIIEKTQSKDILEVGAGANPTLAATDVVSLDLRYTANDVSSKELRKAPDGFQAWVCDLSRDRIPLERESSFDLVFSRMVNEHVSDGRRYHSNIHKLLRPGGISAHCFSTLYCLPFLVNRLIPDSATGLLLNLFSPRDEHKTAKFRAYYSWSRGPSPSMIRQFESLGYEVLDYRGYFGHGYYSRLPLLNRLEGLKARLLLSHPIPSLCSYGMLIARKCR
jgi:SAM-dependent methyltransferase